MKGEHPEIFVTDCQMYNKELIFITLYRLFMIIVYYLLLKETAVLSEVIYILSNKSVYGFCVYAYCLDHRSQCLEFKARILSQGESKNFLLVISLHTFVDVKLTDTKLFFI